jgi:hypothetical protein
MSRNNRGSSVFVGPPQGYITRISRSSNRLRSPEAHLALNGRNILFVNHVKYLGVIFYKRITWRLGLEMIEAKAFRTRTRIYFLFNIKLTLHKSVMSYACPALVSGTPAAPAKQSSSHHCKFFPKVHTLPRFGHGYQPSDCIRLYNKILQAISRSRTKS